MKLQRHENGNKNTERILEPVYLQTLLYANDIVLITDSEEKLQNCETEWGEELTKKEIKVN